MLRLAVIFALLGTIIGALSLDAFLRESPIVMRVEKGDETHATSTSPADPDAAASSWQYASLHTIEKDVVIERIEVSVEGAPLETLHHLTLYTLGTPDAICGTSTHAAFNELYTASRNNVGAPMVFQEPYGLFLAAGTKVGLEFMEHTRAQPHGPGGHYGPHALMVTLYPAKDPSRRPKHLEFIRPRLDDTPCGLPMVHQAFAVPTGNGTYTRRSTGENDGVYVFPKSGVMLTRTANIWPDKGGRSISVFINGNFLERYEPVQLSRSWQYTFPITTAANRVAAGDVLTLEAVYENPFETPIKDAAGIYGFYFSPDPS